MRSYENLNKKNISKYFGEKSTEFVKYIEIDKDFYVNTHNKTIEKLEILRSLCQLYDIDFGQVEFEVEERKKNYGYRGETRKVNIKAYWTKALPIIQETHNRERFKNVVADENNAKAVSIKITKFEIRCTARKEIRVELHLGRKNKEENREAFEILLENKEAIEKTIGEKLVWKSDEKSISYKIFAELKNVDIRNEKDWDDIARFHANISKAFYEAFVDILQGLKQKNNWK